MLNKVQELYDTTSGVIEGLIYIDEHQTDIKASLEKIHQFLDLYGEVIKSSLPDDYYTLVLLDEFYVKLNNGDYDDNIEQFSEDYLKLIDLINNSEICAKIDDVIADFKKKGEEKYEIKLIVDA